MKKIINNRKYDTDKAECVAHYYNAYARSDFNSIDEQLYRTGRDNWFIVGEGGAKTRYARPVGTGGMSGGEALIALTDDEAYDWLEKHDEIEAIEKYFAEYFEEA
jgi:hypothetical protein